MTEKKAKTLIERFGFKDTDLTTPEHDKILLWLLEKKNSLKMLSQLGLIKEKEVAHLHRYNCEKCDWKWIKSNDLFPQGQCMIICSEKEEEKSVRKAKLEANLQEIQKHHSNELIFDKATTIEAEYAILGYNNFNIGFIDAKISITPCNTQENHGGCYFTYQFLDTDNLEKPLIFYIEIKPKIKSIGELIRQINLYRSHQKTGTWIIVTETKGLKEILSTQNIFVYEHDEQLSEA